VNRARALGGVFGPAAFVTAWTIGGAVKHGYSPVEDAISRLAAVGAETRPLMSTGFVVFGAGLVTYASALREVVDGPAWVAAAGTGLATIAVALAPLERSSALDSVHAAFAAIGYITLAATPLLAARPLVRLGHRALAGCGVAVGAIAGVSLALTTSGLPTGLFQRIGLTSGDAWIIASAIAIASGRLAAKH
jgi:hypothetical membrane protein